MKHKSVYLSGLLLAAITLTPSIEAGFPVGLRDDQVADWVKSRVRSLQPTPQEKRFDEIGWAKSIVQAEQLARQNHRPVFLFTQDGRINTGRC
jgi:hypothetical protein